MTHVIKKVKKTIERNDLFTYGETVIVGISGGGDSVALTFLLHHLRHELGIRLHLAHFNHGLRRGAGVDQRFVERWAQELELPLTCAPMRLKNFQRIGSLEERARQMRFDFFMSVARRQKASTIALGHTQDDLAETVLMRILRGTGLMGICSILPKRSIEGFTFVRPLLDVSKKELMSFLKKNKIRFRQDPSNQQKKFFRNKVRLELIPFLEKKYNPNVRQVLANLSDNSTVDYAYLMDRGRTLLDQSLTPSRTKEKLFLDLKVFEKTHPSLQRILIRLAIERLKGNTKRLTLAHIKSIQALITADATNTIVHLPNDIAVRKQSGYQPAASSAKRKVLIIYKNSV